MKRGRELKREFFALLAFAAALQSGCVSVSQKPMRVGSYNIRFSSGDVGTPNAWECRRGDLVNFVKELDLDVFGMQEVCPDQAQYLRENLPDFDFVGEHREADRISGEASPVCYRKSRFELLKKGTFWLSECPDVPGLKGWNAACPRVCSYLVLKDRITGNQLCFANTHTDHISELARAEGVKLIVRRMEEFGGRAPIVFTGDHNCRYDDEPARAVRRKLKDARDISECSPKGPRNTFQGFGRYEDGPVNVKGVRYADYCIDYIYVSDGVRVLDFETHDRKRRGTDLYPSDHYPISATIVVP